MDSQGEGTRMDGKQDRPLALYIHIPFCRARCLYCAFPSRPAGHSTQTRYVEDICREIEGFFSINPGYRIETVYVGGGTPSILFEGDLKYLTDAINAIAPDAIEISFEANPHIDDLPKIPVLLENGINRISIGVQSFNDSELGTIGRLHSADDAREFIRCMQSYGCWNFSIDVIHGLPGQSISTFEKTLDETIGFNPAHVSLYGFSIEPDSRLGHLPQAQFASLGTPDGDTQAEMYNLARRKLMGAGYEQYEISNFAKPGFICRHNMVYWTGLEYVGFGPGATSFLNGARFRRISNVDIYLEALRDRKNTIQFVENLSTNRAATEAMVMGLRTSKGISRKGIENRYGIKITDLVGEALEKYREQGFLEVDDENIRLSDRAYFVSNSIFSDLIL